MKVPVVAGGALVVGLAIGTMLGMHGGPAPVAAAPPPPPVLPAPLATPATAAPRRDSGAASAPKDTTAPSRPDSTHADTVALSAQFDTLAPKAAADASTHLTDAQVTSILRHLSVAKAAAIIGLLPRARAHDVSTALLGGEGK